MNDPYFIKIRSMIIVVLLFLMLLIGGGAYLLEYS